MRLDKMVPYQKPVMDFGFDQAVQKTRQQAQEAKIPKPPLENLMSDNLQQSFLVPKIKDDEIQDYIEAEVQRQVAQRVEALVLSKLSSDIVSDKINASINESFAQLNLSTSKELTSGDTCLNSS